MLASRCPLTYCTPDLTPDPHLHLCLAHLFVCLCIQVLPTPVCSCVHMYSGGQKPMLDVSFHGFQPYFWRQGLPLSLEFTNSVRLERWQTPGIQSPLPRCWAHRYKPPRLLSLCSKLFTTDPSPSSSFLFLSGLPSQWVGAT